MRHRNFCQVFVPMLVVAALMLGRQWAACDEFRYEIAWATYLGGSDYDQLRWVLAYPDGSVIVAGQSHSADYPTTPGVVQWQYAGEPPGTGHPGIYGGDIVISRLSGDGSQLLASTFLGGSRQERSAYMLALDAEGNVIVSSTTRSTDFPTTPGAYQRRYGGGTADTVAAKLTPDLRRLIWATYVGGPGEDWARAGFALDEKDNLILVGRTTTAAFATPGAVRVPSGGWDAAVVKLSADGSRVLFAARFGASGNEALVGVSVATDGRIILWGHSWSRHLPVVRALQRGNAGPAGTADMMLAVLSADGRRLLHWTLLGGANDEFAETAPAVLADGTIALIGNTAPDDFPVTADAWWARRKGGPGDGVIVLFDPTAGTLRYSTFFGGSGSDAFLGPVLDREGNIYLYGQTSSPDLPVTDDAIQPRLAGGDDGYFAILSRDARRLLYATYLGGSRHDQIRKVTVLEDGALLITGRTESPDFPVIPGAYQGQLAGDSDGFVVKLRRVAR